jgi:hypothetical protein
MKKPRKESLADKALEYLKETSKNLFDLSIDLVFSPEKFIGGYAPYRHKSKSYTKYSKEVSRLKYSAYFSIKNNRICLNAKGRVEIIKRIIKDKSKREWDGKWWAIIFDIPERRRGERAFLRKELKWMKFKELQHSVWIFPYDIEKEILVLLKLWKKHFGGDIRFLKIEKLTDDKDLKKMFEL